MKRCNLEEYRSVNNNIKLILLLKVWFLSPTSIKIMRTKFGGERKTMFNLLIDKSVANFQTATGWCVGAYKDATKKRMLVRQNRERATCLWCQVPWLSTRSMTIHSFSVSLWWSLGSTGGEIRSSLTRLPLLCKESEKRNKAICVSGHVKVGGQ